MDPSSSSSVTVTINVPRLNRRGGRTLWYNNFKIGYYRQMRHFVKEKLKGTAKRTKYWFFRGDFSRRDFL